MVEISWWGVSFDTPYGKLELRFRPRIIKISEEDISVSMGPKEFVDFAERIRDGRLHRAELDTLKRISSLPTDKQWQAVRSLRGAKTEGDMEELHEWLNSEFEKARSKREKNRKLRETWEKVEERGFHIRRYRGSKLRYLIICGGGPVPHDFYVIQLPPDYDFKIYRGKSGNAKTLGRRLKESPSKLIEDYQDEGRNIQNLQDDEKAMGNLGNAIDSLPEPWRSELNRRLVALRLTGQKR